MECHRADRQIFLVALALFVSGDKSTAPRSTVPVAPDPTLLPVATTSQAPLIAAYDALNVPAIAAGGSYLDPTTGVKVYKVTSATFPTTSANWGHDYAEGGDEVSLPYSGATRAARLDCGPYWVV